MITQAELREALFYSPIVGVFEWKRPGRRVRRGFLAGSVGTGGYVYLSVNRKRYPAHRLAWLYMTGEYPDAGIDIDHIDGDRSNNAFSNLRKAMKSQNSCNSKCPSSSSTGIKGVRWCKESGRWIAAIRNNGRYVFRESYSTKEEAANEISQARKRLHGEFANDGVHGYMKEELAS